MSQPTDRIQRALTWVQTAMMEGDAKSIELFQNITSKRSVPKLSEILQSIGDEVWEIWFAHTDGSEQTVYDDYVGGSIWLLEKLLHRLSYDKVRLLISEREGSTQNLLVEESESVQRKLPPFLETMVQNNVSALSRAIASTLTEERSLQVLKGYLVDVPNLRSGTQVSLQETILDLISTAISKDTELTDIVEMYVLHIPVSSVEKDLRVRSTLRSQRESLIQYGYSWIEYHVVDHAEFTAQEVFAHLRFVATSIEESDRHRSRYCQC